MPNKWSRKGPRTVAHPKARIIAEAGPICIGEGNLIEEQALIINGYPENIMPDAEGMEPKSMTIGTIDIFEVGCAVVGRNTILTSGCIVGACCQVNTCEVIPENAVVYGSDCMRRIQMERPQPESPARLPDEDSSQLPPSEENRQSKLHSCKKRTHPKRLLSPWRPGPRKSFNSCTFQQENMAERRLSTTAEMFLCGNVFSYKEYSS